MSELDEHNFWIERILRYPRGVTESQNQGAFAVVSKVMTPRASGKGACSCFLLERAFYTCGTTLMRWRLAYLGFP